MVDFDLIVFTQKGGKKCWKENVPNAELLIMDGLCAFPEINTAMNVELL